MVDLGRTRTAFGSSNLAACSLAFEIRAGTATIQSSQVLSAVPSSVASSSSSVPTFDRLDRAETVVAKDLMPLLIGQLLPLFGRLQGIQLAIPGLDQAITGRLLRRAWGAAKPLLVFVHGREGFGTLDVERAESGASSRLCVIAGRDDRPFEFSAQVCGKCGHLCLVCWFISSRHAGYAALQRVSSARRPWSHSRRGAPGPPRPIG